jgi:ring-1,2-phenylacetyl-CoA epoxidase subunit PaaD
MAHLTIFFSIFSRFIPDAMITKEHILEALLEVHDPEIPTLSVVDLGIVTDISIADNNAVAVTITPTFVGCPAIEVMQQEIRDCVIALGLDDVKVYVNYDTPWDSNRITEKGKQALRSFGLAPPPSFDMVLELDILHDAVCPYCHSTNTVMQSPFGPTLCRSIHYCNNCLQAFEQFKPVG